MISITISIVLSDIPRPYPVRPEYTPRQGRIYPFGGLYEIVLVDQWRQTAGPHMVFDEADIFCQINLRDLAAEFAKNKTRKFHYFEIPSRPMQID